MTTKPDIAPKAMDVAARSIDLLALLTRVAHETDAGAFVMKEIGRWLGKEGLDENELQFFLESTKAMIRPNDQTEITTFFDAVNNRKAKKTVVPLWAQPSGALGRLVSKDPQQRWITSTISCLFQYHDERFIKFVLCGLILQHSHKGEAPLSEYQLGWHPDTLRLSEVVNKVVHSNWLHIANAGLIGSESECPRLPEELFSCEKGHNIESYKLSLVMSRLTDPPAQVIFQSEHLLTNLVLWILWHFHGRLRVVISGRVVYDKVLGSQDSIIECRVSKFCVKQDEGDCTSSKTTPTFDMLDNISGNMKLIFRGKYDSQQTLMSESRVRKKLYHSPFQYPKSSRNSISIQTQRTAQEILRWFVNLKVSEKAFSSRLDFHISLFPSSKSSASDLRVGDLLGRTPGLLNMQCGELGRAFVVFSPPRETTPPTVENFMSMDSDYMASSGGASDTFEDRPEILLKYFPILEGLIQYVRSSCKCFHCYKDGPYSSFQFDENCLQYKAFMEVMLYLGHGIADSFGAPDASHCGEAIAGDSGATAILLDAIEGVRMNYQAFDGVVRWNTLLSTSTQIFLGCPPLDKLTDATYNDASVDTSPHFTQHLSSSVIAVQHGGLAVVAPWLDISQHLSCRGCFQFTIAEGQLGLPIDNTSNGPVLQQPARDTVVIETQYTEDVSDYASRNKVPQHASTGAIELLEDRSECFCDYVLLSVDETRYKLLMRVSSKSHSRMVDPSMAMLKLASKVFPVACGHTKSLVAVVPEQTTAEMYEFDELLGRWGDTTTRETVSSNNSPGAPESPSEGENASQNIASPPAIGPNASVATRATETESAPNPHQLRISHILNSSFKYNTALALTHDDPVFVNRGDACLQCCLNQGSDYEDTGFEQSNARWIINKVNSPGRQVPRTGHRLKSTGLREAVKAGKKSIPEGNAGPQDDIMVLDE
ncbi:hypothetical protein BGZ57DRAFT_261866 [Hyaloscypha finlandica]|nr:hypothetical protein BGZ57DRAFT_261866 [Hyaloscypha finlandica]